MKTLIKKKEHNPMLSAVSTFGDTQFTFCQECEQNIDRFWLEFDGDRMDMWSDWRITK